MNNPSYAFKEEVRMYVTSEYYTDTYGGNIISHEELEKKLFIAEKVLIIFALVV